MKVFISYGNAADQVMALRLQALAAVTALRYTYRRPTLAKASQRFLIPRLVES